MCPRCVRGLVNGSVCEQCAGTGFWNPESLSVKEVQVMDEQATIEVPVTEGSSVGIATATVEAQDSSSNQTQTDQGVQAEPIVIGSAEDQVNG